MITATALKSTLTLTLAPFYPSLCVLELLSYISVLPVKSKADSPAPALMLMLMLMLMVKKALSILHSPQAHTGCESDRAFHSDRHRDYLVTNPLTDHRLDLLRRGTHRSIVPESLMDLVASSFELKHEDLQCIESLLSACAHLRRPCIHQAQAE